MKRFIVIRMFLIIRHVIDTITQVFSKEASLNEVKASFYKKAKELHPDVSPLNIDQATNEFIKLIIIMY